MSINELDEKNQSTEESKEINTTPNESSIDPETINFMAIADILGMDHAEISRNDSKFRNLMEYVQSSTDDLSHENIKWVIRDLRMKIGSPMVGEKIIDYLNRYAYLLKEQNNINKELDKFKKGGISD